MEEAGVIGVFSLLEAASILGEEAFQQGFKNGIAEKGLPGCDGLNEPDKMRRRLPFAELFHTLNEFLFIHLRGGAKENSLARSPAPYGWPRRGAGHHWGAPHAAGGERSPETADATRPTG